MFHIQQEGRLNDLPDVQAKDKQRRCSQACRKHITVVSQCHEAMPSIRKADKKKLNEPTVHSSLRLEGPMQSWGYRSRFDYRDTALEPTRSGVIGLICAAMGIARGEDISRFDAIRMGVRVDAEGRPERDYHTALDVIKATESGTDTVVSYRDYLADASFTVGLQSEE